MVRNKLVPEEKPICNAVNVFRERGNYLQRLEQFEKAIQAYNEALRWNNTDVKSLLGRSLARAKATHYTGALADAVRAAELEPENLTALQIKAHTEYEKRAFERALVLSHRGRRIRHFPNDFAETARHAEETVRECVGRTTGKVFSSAVSILHSVDFKKESVDADAPSLPKRRSRMQPQPTQQVQEISRAEKQKAKQISRLMASMYLERMAHDKYFLTALCKDERLVSANKQGSKDLQKLAHKALADIEERQAVLRERRPLYAARASEATARARLSKTRKAQIKHAQKQHITDAQRLIRSAQALYEKRDTAKCLETAEFGMEQISRKPGNLLPGKEKFLQQLCDIVSEVFLDQKRVRKSMSESDREKRAFILLGMALSREPSRDSVLRARPHAPPRDAKLRLRTLVRHLASSTRSWERCYLLHELARLHVDTKQALKARYFAFKCQSVENRVFARAYVCHLNHERDALSAVLVTTARNTLMISGIVDAPVDAKKGNIVYAVENRVFARAYVCHLNHERDALSAVLVTTARNTLMISGIVDAPVDAKKARAANHHNWLLNASFMLARCHLLQNNRPEARAVLLEGAGLARSYGFDDIASFYDTCVNVSVDGEVAANDDPLEKREKAMVSLMQDDEMKSAATHLFRKMSVIPAARRFSIMPGTRVEETTPISNRRASIAPKSQQPTRIAHKTQHPLGLQEFDI